MQQLVVFATLISCAFATYHHAAPHIVPGPTVLTKNVHHVPAVAPVVNVQRTVQAVHHPPVTSVHHAPDVVVQKAPRIHGYAYASEVRHDAPVAHAAPIVHAAPVVAHAAPVVAHAAPVVHAAPIAHGYAGHGYAGHGIAAPVVGHGYGKAPVVNPGPIVQVGHAPVEQPAVSSYSINTGRVHVATQAHYGVAHKLGVINVPGVKTIAETVKHVPVAVSSHVVGHAPVAHGYGGHY